VAKPWNTVTQAKRRGDAQCKHHTCRNDIRASRQSQVVIKPFAREARAAGSDSRA
jgi:hypothetical protein